MRKIVVALFVLLAAVVPALAQDEEVLALHRHDCSSGNALTVVARFPTPAEQDLLANCSVDIIFVDSYETISVSDRVSGANQLGTRFPQPDWSWRCDEASCTNKLGNACWKKMIDDGASTALAAEMEFWCRQNLIYSYGVMGGCTCWCHGKKMTEWCFRAV